ncbi:hypothetical protein BCV69DRAFT_253939, partial [Microstroma glucosiphilum]
VQQIVYPRERITVLDSLLVERSVVNAEPQLTILLWYKEDWRSIGRTGGLNPSCFHFFLKVCPERVELILGQSVDRSIHWKGTFFFINAML